MSLTSGQLLTLQTWINANQAANAAAGNITSIQSALNAQGTPATQVYSPAIPNTQLAAAIVSSDVAALTVQQAIAVQIMLMPSSIDGTNATVQGNIGGLFVGKTTLTNFGALARNATVFELLFTTNHVVAANAQGQSMYGYQPSFTDITAAMKGSY